MRRFGLSDLIVGLVVVSVVSTWGVIGWSHIYRESRMEACGSNLSQIIKAAYNYSCGGKCPEEGCFPQDRGGAWPLVQYRFQEVDASTCWCPVRGDGRVGETHYRGPAVDANTLGGGQTILCDRSDNHPDHWPINAVLKSGDVIRVERGTTEFDRVMKETAP